MDITDILIIIVLIIFAITGFKRGVLKSIVSFVGIILIVCFAYLFKDILGNFFVLNLPFINFSISNGNSVVLNIVMYQTIAFVIMLAFFGIIYRIVIAVTGIVEKILKLTIILGIPSKILGFVIGILEGYILIYLVLFFVAQPYISSDILDNSKYASIILNKTPVLSDFSSNTLNIINEVHDIVKSKDEDNFDLKLANLILKENVISPDIMQRLVDNKKIEVTGIESVIDKYKNGGENND